MQIRIASPRLVGAALTNRIAFKACMGSFLDRLGTHPPPPAPPLGNKRRTGKHFRMDLIHWGMTIWVRAGCNQMIYYHA